MALAMTKKERNDIPLDIVIELLSRLPARTLVRFRRVCKLWRSITLDPRFIDTHLDRARNAPSILLSFRCHKRDRFGITILDNEGAPKPLLSGPTPEDGETILNGSCNGLLLVYHSHGRMEVVNPATGESLTPPEATQGGTGSAKVVMHAYLGFHPLTKEYKVVRLFAHNSVDDLNACEVYTLGTGSWRRTRTSPLNHFPLGRAATAKGVMYWSDVDGSVVSFDLKDERFARISPPDFEEIYGGREAKALVHELPVELQGGVCLPVFRRPKMDIWMLNDDGGAKHEWILKYSLVFPSMTYEARPLSILDDKILMLVGVLDSRGGAAAELQCVDLLRYHRLRGKNRSGKEIYRGYGGSLLGLEPFVHVESLVPLPNK